MASEVLKKTTGEGNVCQYDVSAIPNDFNIMTIYNLIDSGAIAMPNFQRNYIWDKKQASRLIESIILGLPIPQIFLYQTERNKFLVIDGQQRLLSIYYFIKQRFPLKEHRSELRRVFDDNNIIPESVLNDDKYFQDFKLNLPSEENEWKSPLNGCRYTTLGKYKTTFEYMTLRCVVIRQNEPKDNDNSVFEIFSRLNTGGVNLSPQEIRACLYDSPFFRMLNDLNINETWRKIYGKPENDKAKDIEIILRCFAMLSDNETYNGIMNGFINRFSKKAMGFSDDEVQYLFDLFISFLDACKGIDRNLFCLKNNTSLNVGLFECLFTVIAEKYYHEKKLVAEGIDVEKIEELKNNKEFENSITHSTAHTKNVKTRLSKAREYLQK